MGLRRGLGAMCAAALAHSAAAVFSTTLHGAPTQTIQPGTPGAATLQLQPWLTTIDPDVRTRSAGRHSVFSAAPVHPLFASCAALLARIAVSAVHMR